MQMHVPRLHQDILLRNRIYCISAEISPPLTACVYSYVSIILITSLATKQINLPTCQIFLLNFFTLPN
jgi:hypothetical protein